MGRRVGRVDCEPALVCLDGECHGRVQDRLYIDVIFSFSRRARH